MAALSTCFLFKSTGTDAWTHVYIETQVPFCLTVLLEDQNFNHSKYQNLTNGLCVNNCSNHGTCIAGKTITANF